jgi:potassium-transporting ATPase KdpC subunit
LDPNPIFAALVVAVVVPFAVDKYFYGRPSATTYTGANDPTKTVPAPYNAQNSGGSNLGPTSKALIDRVKGDVEKFKAESNKPIPVDLTTASASGLDPDILLATAAFQTVTCARREGTSFMRSHVAGTCLRKTPAKPCAERP